MWFNDEVRYVVFVFVGFGVVISLVCLYLSNSYFSAVDAAELNCAARVSKP